MALAELSRRKPILKNRVAPEVETAVVELAIEQPAFGQARASNELMKRDITVSPFGVRSIWLKARSRHHVGSSQGAGSQDGAGALHPHAEPACGSGESQGRQGSPWRVRQPMSRLLRGAGHFLCRHPQGCRPGLSADL